MGALKIGLQLYTVRDNTEKDFEGTLRAVAAMGYEGVEFAGYGGISAEEMKALLTELNLTAIGSHISLEQLENNLEGEIEYLKTIGARYGVLPYLQEKDRGSDEKWLALIEKLDRFGEAFRQNGLIFGYHNHEFEFTDKLDGGYVFDAIYEKVAPERLQVEMDIGWVQYSGLDPLAYIAKYKGRLPLLHLKDYRKGEPGEQIDTVELGQGDLDLPSIIASAEKADVEWIIVEQDRCANPSLEAVKTSKQWLNENYKG
ncbi:sugar phosphate isomerase/epimerase family protein [Paenibacillus pinihumi]|uniref:sugar phosphate isomerase/epimerase family protein n=1 Tax=Paenibacillus pinihumi TaxID=669462 RepID=UPI0004075CDC|nr:sugar phosphate isomerase/epimerase [Paenibacillus pinihumi]